MQGIVLLAPPSMAVINVIKVILMLFVTNAKRVTIKTEGLALFAPPWPAVLLVLMALLVLLVMHAKRVTIKTK